jgi:tagaturonate reductase
MRMTSLTRATLGLPPAASLAPERILQIGEGKFIRAFVDYLIQALGRQGLFEGCVVLTPARAQGAPKLAALQAQDCLFTIWTRGLVDGARIDQLETVSIISRIVNPFVDWQAFLRCSEQPELDIVVSNTTEMGLTYVPTRLPQDAAPASYPARLTAYLAHRFATFRGDPGRGMVILPTELIDDNATVLRELVLRHAADWQLGPAFSTWIRQHNVFCNTLVDRIVPGMPAHPEEAYARLGYKDTQLIATEPFHLWAIDADSRAMQRLPFEQSSLHVQYTTDLAPFRIQKLRVLNGTHTFLTPLGLLLGCTTVREALLHPTLGPVIRSTVEQVTVRFSELPEDVLREYARSVYDRFLNPFIDHQLRDIMLNALVKFRIRLLPVLLRYAQAQGEPPRALSLSLAALLILYRPEHAALLADQSPSAALATATWNSGPDLEPCVQTLLAEQRIWDQDLSAVPGLTGQVVEYAARVQRGELADMLDALAVTAHQE